MDLQDITPVFEIKKSKMFYTMFLPKVKHWLEHTRGVKYKDKGLYSYTAKNISVGFFFMSGEQDNAILLIELYLNQGPLLNFIFKEKD